MANIHAREADKSNVSEEPTESLAPGDIVTRESGGGAHKTDPGSDDDWDGIVLHLEGGDHIADHERDYRSSLDDFTYDPVSQDSYEDTINLAPIQLQEDGAVFRPYAQQDDSEPAPSIQRLDTVGVITLNGSQQIVEDGYTDNGGTTYGDGNTGDFLALGEAEVPANETFDSRDKRVPIRV